MRFPSRTSSCHFLFHRKNYFPVFPDRSNSLNKICVSLTNSFLLALNPSSPSVSTASSFRMICARIDSLRRLYSISLVLGSDGGCAKKCLHLGTNSERNVRERASRVSADVFGRGGELGCCEAAEWVCAWWAACGEEARGDGE